MNEVNDTYRFGWIDPRKLSSDELKALHTRLFPELYK